MDFKIITCVYVKFRFFEAIPIFFIIIIIICNIKNNWLILAVDFATLTCVFGILRLFEAISVLLSDILAFLDFEVSTLW